MNTVDRQRIWFPDTASLLSMAVDEAIIAAMLAAIRDDTILILDVVLDELAYRAKSAETGQLAKKALGARPEDWIVVDTSRYVRLEDVLDAQRDVADGRALTDERQHWAESTVIAMGRRSAEDGYASVKVLLSEDYDARRVASSVPNMTGVSVHGLLHARVHAEKMTPGSAADLAKLLQDAERGPEVTAEDFADPSGRALGRVGVPIFRL